MGKLLIKISYNPKLSYFRIPHKSKNELISNDILNPN